LEVSRKGFDDLEGKVMLVRGKVANNSKDEIAPAILQDWTDFNRLPQNQIEIEP
jgi:hypothetical protein